MAIANEQWLVFKLSDNQCALPIDSVREMARMGDINRLPNTPIHMMGTMRLRDRVMPVMDLRTRLGMPSMDSQRDTLIELLKAREADHVRWLNEL